ncbi:unnamed protein product [Polarella glacialis]|uniref:Uncharacterized protein n=1 Tax=Polarella glacialis TaxID=89957 RepID=A0A813F998_POLGL|nr:unnamed protein product [Polarella glacialis]
MQENGKVICKFCCDLVEVPCLRMHLHPHYKEAKRHRSLQQTWAEPIEWLKTSGWQLESQRIRCENGEFRCKCNPKPMNLYDLRGEAGHLQSKKHKDFLASLPAPEPGAEAMQREAWALKMPSACEEHIRCLVRQQTSRAKAVAARAPKAAPPVPRPMPPVAGPAAGTSTGSREAPDQAPMQEPPLPVMGKDFPRLVKGSSNVAQKDGGLWCSICDIVVKGDEETHIRTKGHVSYETIALDAYKKLQACGDKLWREGVAIKDKNAECSCGKSLNWWQLFEPNHIETKNHMKWHRNSDLPDMKTMPWEEARRRRWQQAFGQSDGQQESAAAPCEPSASSSTQEVSRKIAAQQVPSEVLPPAKKQRVLAEASEETGRAAPNTAEYPEPSTQDLADASKNAENRGVPQLKAPLTWGYFDKGKAKTLYAWCKACSFYVGVVPCPGGIPSPDAAEQGVCRHFDFDSFKSSSGK